jgi:hypothetical protein
MEREPLHQLLSAYFAGRGHDKRLADRAADRFLQMVTERSGLLTVRGDSNPYKCQLGDLSHARGRRRFIPFRGRGGCGKLNVAL